LPQISTARAIAVTALGPPAHGCKLLRRESILNPVCSWAAVTTPSPYDRAARLRIDSARLQAQVGAALERSRALRWDTLAVCSRIRPIQGGSDESAAVVSVITGTALCHDCIAVKTGITVDQVATILTTVSTTISIAMSTRPCASCGEIKCTYCLEAPRSPDGAPARPRTTQRTILEFLGAHGGSEVCAACISGTLFAGKDIDVAMRHLEGSGVLRRHGRCSTCGRLRLVASLSPLN
jgi:hypothetical protein